MKQAIDFLKQWGEAEGRESAFASECADAVIALESHAALLAALVAQEEYERFWDSINKEEVEVGSIGLPTAEACEVIDMQLEQADSLLAHAKILRAAALSATNH